MMQEFIKTVKFGDIIEYTTVLDGHGIGDMGVFARTPLDDDGNPRPRVYDPNDTFEVVGSVFETPLASIYAKEIDGEQMIAVRIVDGSEYVIADHPGKNQYENAIYFEQPATEPSAAKPLPNALGDADSSGSVDLLDVIALNKNILGVMPPDSAKAALDLNHDGVIDSSDSLLLLRYMVGLEEIG